MTEIVNPQKKLKILQVLPSLVSGGVERGTLDLSNYLIKQGHEAWVISSGGALVKPLEALGAKHIIMPVQSKNPFVMWMNSLTLCRLQQQHGFDLIHARSRAPAWSCYWACKQLSIPFITTFHGQYGHQNKLKRTYNSVMLKSDTCIAVSVFIETHIKTIYPNHKAVIKLIRRGIDLNTFNNELTIKESAVNLKKKWGISEHDTVIILPGRLTRIKGHKIFIEAISKLKDEQFCRYLIVGDEPGKNNYQKELDAQIKEHHLSHIVQFTGNCDDMPAAYALADIVISASIKPESFGRTACEAQAMGCLVVATNHGGSLETIAPIQQQFMCNISDSDSMVASIKKALFYCRHENQEERRKIDAQSRCYIEENFSLNKMCSDTIDLYQEVLSRHER